MAANQALPATPVSPRRPSLTIKRRLNARAGEKSTPRGPTRKNNRDGSGAVERQARLVAGGDRCPRSAAATASASMPIDGEYFEVGGVYRESGAERAAGVQLGLAFDAGARIAGDDLAEAGWRRHAAHAASRAVLRRGRARRPRARWLERTARPSSKDSSPETHQQRSRPCSRTRSSRARNGSPRAKPIWRMRRNSPSARDRLERGAPRAALGQGRQGLCVRRTERQGRRWPTCSAGRSQLVVQHFMFAPGLERGLQELLVLGRRLRAHDPASRRARHHAGGDLARAAAKSSTRSRQRMGWTFDWLSSADGDFNYDYAVSFTPERRSSQATRSTISAPPASASRMRPASACSTATRPATSSTPIRASRAAST